MHNISLHELKIIDHIIKYKFASKAASALDLTAPTISYTLKKLRIKTGNKLFVPTKEGMIPDKCAIALQKRFQQISHLSSERRDFIITTYSPLELLIGLYIAELPETPLFLRFVSMPDTIEQRLNNLKLRYVDVDIGGRLPPDRSILSLPYLESEMCVMVNENHSTIHDDFSIDDWQKNYHITWLHESGDLARVIHDLSHDRLLVRDRKVICESTNLLAMTNLCARSEHIMMIPRIFCESIKKVFPVKFFNLPDGMSVRFGCHIHYHRENKKNINIDNVIRLFDNVF